MGTMNQSEEQHPKDIRKSNVMKVTLTPNPSPLSGEGSSGVLNSLLPIEGEGLGMRGIIFLFLMFILIGCGQQNTLVATSVAPVAPLQPTALGATATIAATQVVIKPTATPELKPTFATYNDPRAIFSMDVPTNWQTTPLDQGVGFTTLAYNASVVMTISFSWQAQPLDPDQQVQLVEDVKARTFNGYLTKDIVLESKRNGTQYILNGTATLNGVPTHVEFTLDQTAGGTIYLQSWLVPSEIWTEFQTTFKQPMQASLKVDDAAAKNAAGN